jgi:hypothetical protein
MNVIWCTATSMDGRIADGNDSLEFLETIGPAHPVGVSRSQTVQVLAFFVVLWALVSL